METRIILLCRKYLKREIDARELNELESWLAQNDEHKRLFLYLLSLSKAESQSAALRQTNAADAWAKICRKKRRKRRRVLLFRLVMAACLALIVGVAFYWKTASDFFSSPMPPQLSLSELFPDENKHDVVLSLADGRTIVLSSDSLQRLYGESGVEVDVIAGKTSACRAEETQKEDARHMLSVPVGRTFAFVLPDGTKVWLNSETTLSYSADFEKRRRVELSGEAFFEVIRNGFPFEVTAGGSKVSVLGTVFNLSAYPSAPVQTTLVEGKVVVNHKNHTQTLLPGQQAEIVPNSSEIMLKNVRVDLFTSWRTGMLEFRNTSLEDILQQFSLWYGVSVRYETSSLKQIRLGGNVFKNRPLGYSLELIERVADVKFSREGNTVIVSAIAQ